MTFALQTSALARMMPTRVPGSGRQDIPWPALAGTTSTTSSPPSKALRAKRLRFDGVDMSADMWLISSSLWEAPVRVHHFPAYHHFSPQPTWTGQRPRGAGEDRRQLALVLWLGHLPPRLALSCSQDTRCTPGARRLHSSDRPRHEVRKRQRVPPLESNGTQIDMVTWSLCAAASPQGVIGSPQGKMFVPTGN